MQRNYSRSTLEISCSTGFSRHSTNKEPSCVSTDNYFVVQSQAQKIIYWKILFQEVSLWNMPCEGHETGWRSVFSLEVKHCGLLASLQRELNLLVPYNRSPSGGTLVLRMQNSTPTPSPSSNTCMFLFLCYSNTSICTVTVTNCLKKWSHGKITWPNENLLKNCFLGLSVPLSVLLRDCKILLLA